MIRLLISLTTLTLEVSTKPCITLPKPGAPGTPATAVPDAALCRNRLSPCASSPASLGKLASWICPSVVGVVALAIVACTCPAPFTVTAVALFGTVMPGATG